MCDCLNVRPHVEIKGARQYSISIRWFTVLFFIPHREATIVMLGLDGAGKSTVVANITGGTQCQSRAYMSTLLILTDDVYDDLLVPTIGFSRSSFKINKYHHSLYDLGGGETIRDIWSKYYAEVGHCLVSQKLTTHIIALFVK